jgi:hypothetical protein
MSGNETIGLKSVPSTSLSGLSSSFELNNCPPLLGNPFHVPSLVFGKPDVCWARSANESVDVSFDPN